MPTDREARLEAPRHRKPRALAIYSMLAMQKQKKRREWEGSASICARK